MAILGNSCALEVAGGRRTREDRTWGEWLEEFLDGAGHPATVHNQARWFELINEGMSRYLDDIRPVFADVLVVQYGCNECQPRALPTRLARHYAGMRQGSGRLAMGYRRRILEPYGWRIIRRWQRWAAPRSPRGFTRLSLRRWEEELRRVIKLGRTDGMLVILVDVSAFGPRFEYWIPSVGDRREPFQRALEAIVAECADPAVMRLDPEQAFAGMERADAIPDGLHWGPEAHRRVAALIADAALAWDDTPAPNRRPRSSRIAS